MSIISTDEIFNKSGELAELIEATLQDNGIKIPIPDPITILMSKIRTGMDASAISSSIKSRFEEIGIPQGTLDGGQPNVMEGYSDIMSAEIVNAIQSDMRIDVALGQGAVITQGSNSAGPVVGTNAAPSPPGTISGLAS